MKRTSFALALVLLALLGCRSHTAPASSGASASVAQPQAQAAAPQFDFYLLNISWSPEYCHTHPSAAQCAVHSTFVLHGLWPQNADGTWPQNCSTTPGPADPSQYSDIYSDQSLLEHEWSKHGTCSGLSPDGYLSAARKAFQSVKIPPKLAELKTQTSLPPDQIFALVTAANPQIPREALAVSCGNNYLTAIEVCLDKNLQPMACSGLHSCRANTIKIPPP